MLLEICKESAKRSFIGVKEVLEEGGIWESGGAGEVFTSRGGGKDMLVTYLRPRRVWGQPAAANCSSAKCWGDLLTTLTSICSLDPSDRTLSIPWEWSLVKLSVTKLLAHGLDWRDSQRSPCEPRETGFPISLPLADLQAWLCSHAIGIWEKWFSPERHLALLSGLITSAGRLFFFF